MTPGSVDAWVRVSSKSIVATLLATITQLLTIARPATAQVVDPTDSNFAIWGAPSLNRPIGPDDVVVQVAGGSGRTVALLADGSVASPIRDSCQGPIGCKVPSASSPRPANLPSTSIATCFGIQHP